MLPGQVYNPTIDPVRAIPAPAVIRQIIASRRAELVVLVKLLRASETKSQFGNRIVEVPAHAG